MDESMHAGFGERFFGQKSHLYTMLLNDEVKR